MRPAVHRSQLEQELSKTLQGRHDSPWFRALSLPHPEKVPSGIPEIDALTEGGIPRGHITEVIGLTSSGKTSLLLSILSRVSCQNEVVSLIDPGNAFDLVSATVFGVYLDRLLWIRASRRTLTLDQILKTTDLLVQGGGFGLIGVDLSDIPVVDIRRISPAVWFRLQRAAENTPTILLFLNREPALGTTATLALRMDVVRSGWSGRLLREVRPGVRVVRSRHHPSSCWQTRLLHLYPTACIAAGHADTKKPIRRKSTRGITP